MHIESFESFLMPSLRALFAGEALDVDTLATAVADELDLSDAARAHTLTWSDQPIYVARAEQAVKALTVAGLVERDGHVHRLTARGREVVAAPPARLDQAFLEANFPTYRAHREEVLRRRGA